MSILIKSSFLISFIDYLKFEKRYSPHTITSYNNDISQFSFFIAKTYTGITIDKIGHNHIRSWMVELVNNSISSKSINRKISSLRSFYNYLMKQAIVSKNPTLKIVTPKIAKRLPEFIQERNIAKIFDNIIDGDFEDFRNRLIIEFFYSTGIRRIELINIKDGDIDSALCTIKVLGKGNKERIIPFSKNLLLRIERYIKLRAEFFEDSHYDQIFFVTSKGSKMYPKLVYNIVKKYLSDITTSSKRSPHILRHTFATHMMNGGADLNAVKELLGHANLAATQIYTHNSIEKLKEVYKKAHPKSENK